MIGKTDRHGKDTVNEDGSANTFWQAILGDPEAMSLIDITKTQGALDGMVELIDFKGAAEKGEKGVWNMAKH